MTIKYKDLSNAIRFLSIDAVEKAKSGHPGLPMGMADVVTILFKNFLNFNPKNPMSRLRWKEYKNALCFLQVSVSALADGEFLISDGNAASPVTKFYKSLDQLDLLPWDVINAEYWNDLDDGSRKRCAEVLIYPKIKPEHIESIFCFSIDTKNYLENYGINIIYV